MLEEGAGEVVALGGQGHLSAGARLEVPPPPLCMTMLRCRSALRVLRF